MSSRFQAVVLGASLTGWGAFPELTQFHQLDLLMGISCRICGSRIYPAQGVGGGCWMVVVMVKPHWVDVRPEYRRGARARPVFDLKFRPKRGWEWFSKLGDFYHTGGLKFEADKFINTFNNKGARWISGFCGSDFVFYESRVNFKSCKSCHRAFAEWRFSFSIRYCFCCFNYVVIGNTQ